MKTQLKYGQPSVVRYIGISTGIVVIGLLMMGFGGALSQSDYSVTGIPHRLVLEGNPSSTAGALYLSVDALPDKKLVLDSGSGRTLFLGALSTYTTGSEITVKGHQVGKCTGGLCIRTIEEIVF